MRIELRDITPIIPALIVVGAAWGLTSLWQCRGSYENSSPDQIDGFGYTITPSRFHQDVVRLDARATNYPFQLVSWSVEKGRQRVREACGRILETEQVTVPKSLNATTIYLKVNRRDQSTCFPNHARPRG